MAVRLIDGNELLKKFAYSPADTEDEQVFNAAARKIIQEVPTITPPNEWVSVNKRLPEKRKDVLVHYGNGRIGIDWIDSTQCFVFDELYGRVTHWLPIPELPDRRPPEGEDGDANHA
ncbi:DUF551 domain-containing protein [Flintibacter sp. P01028]|jgi:hypothetical protein|uniref:DUF551 domain-containing protein n=1 Tax=Flintibacter sp. P01028 TaxID=3342382 RepID=UPI002055B36B|nr:MAG TPA: Protein of unknown function (DUF551) [Caudoviricetes sp.]